MKYQVLFAIKANTNLANLFLYVAEQSGEERARKFIAAIRSTCHGLDTFPQRGRLRKKGFRVISHGKRTNIIFRIENDRVIIMGILYGGQDLDRHF